MDLLNARIMRTGTHFLLLIIASFTVQAQTVSEPPVGSWAFPVDTPARFERAVERGTRTLSGVPGDRYWTNYAHYRIDAEILPGDSTLVGRETVTYLNRSPDAIRSLAVHLYMNIHQPEAARNRRVTDTNAGVRIQKVHVAGKPAVTSVNGTVMTVILTEPLEPGQERELAIDWSIAIPRNGIRMGRSDDEVFLAYWYPQIAVYDDVNGWKADQYLGRGEFYMGYADYDVRLTLPEGWLVTATGTLENADQVLAPAVRRRLQEVTQGEVKAIVADGQQGVGRATLNGTGGKLTWNYKATNVRDFVFGASPTYVWDATRAVVGDRDGDGRPDTTLIQSFYPPDDPLWTQSAADTRYAIEWMSRFFFAYPYPHMTAFQGSGMGGGMEYPMMTLIGRSSSERALFSVTFHEVGHMWFPMIVGSDEKQFAWMDEGLTTYNTGVAESAHFNVETFYGMGGYYAQMARSGNEEAIMQHVDDMSAGGAGFAAYQRPALNLWMLRGLVGAERFDAAYRQYARSWQFKHPVAHDFFNAMEQSLGEDLDWFWTPMFYQTWTIDQAITNVQAGDSILVTVRNLGRAPVPTPLRVTYASGTVENRTIPVSVWLDGDAESTIAFPGGVATEVVIDPEGFVLDVNRTNNTWRPTP